MTSPRIAAVITCRNLGRTLVEALDSVERQTRPAAEIVIVDDASTDIYTRQVLLRLAREGTRVVHAEGAGASAARNLGARLTSAEYLVWLDGDDVLESSYFSAAAARLDADATLDFVSCAMRAFGAASYVWHPSPPTFVEAVATGGVPHASTMVRRRLWEAVGGFDETLPSFELLDFWASVIERGVHGVILGEPLLNYRIRPGSGYRRSIQPETYRARLRHFYGKHRAAVECHGLELIERKEAFLQGQREYHGTLVSKVRALEAEIARLRREIADTAKMLESRGVPRVDWGDFRRMQPLSQYWGWDRGKPVDRYYIEAFLERHRADVRGRVLEVRDRAYTERFGGEAVEVSDVVDIVSANGAATLVADLRRAPAIPTATYDCIILTQTLQLIDDIPAALAECERILRPGGVLLVTVPSVIRLDDEGGLDGDFWRLTEASARKLFADVFPFDAFEVASHGNVLACAALLYGMSVEELAPADLDPVDPNFPLVITVRAVKPLAVTDVGATGAASGFRHSQLAGRGGTPTGVASGFPGLSRAEGRTYPAIILAYHRIADLRPDSHALCTPPDEFQAHMAHLRREFRPIALEDLIRLAAAGEIPEGAVAVTLDDGYLDALTVASPILTDLGVPATFFVNTDCPDEEHERWWDILERILLGEQTLPPALALHVGGHDLHMSTTTAADRARALERVNQLAWPLDASARQTLVDAILAWSGVDAAPRATHRVLMGAEIRALASRPGHSIGAHSVHHLALATQPADVKRREVIENKVTLEHVVGRPIRLFAYPYGEFDAETLAAVREAGFRAAVTIDAGLVTACANRLLLPRFEVTPHRHGAFPQFMREILEQSRQPAPV